MAEALRLSGLTAAAAEIERLRSNGSADFIGALKAFYWPFEGLPRRLRDGDDSAVEPALLFLEADPWCFHSGYMKADLVSALAHGPDLGPYRARVHRLIVHRLRHHEPRLARPVIRLAAATWGTDLDQRLESCASTASEELRASIEELRLGVLHQVSTEAGAT